MESHFSVMNEIENFDLVVLVSPLQVVLQETVGNFSRIRWIKSIIIFNVSLGTKSACTLGTKSTCSFQLVENISKKTMLYKS